MSKLAANNISISYSGEKILHELDLAVEEGEFVAILGPSGCGKSTLLNILAGILEKEQGEIYVDGAKISGLSPHFAYMPQDDLLLPWKNVVDNVCLYASLNGDLKTARQKALLSMEEFGLLGYEQSYPSSLSGGMRQRAAFLRTAMCPADILLLDEPFASLDVITRGDMQDWLLSMRRALSRTTLLVTHDIDEAIYLADRILVLSGRPARIQKEIRPKHEHKTREWLFNQAELKREIYTSLKEVAK